MKTLRSVAYLWPGVFVAGILLTACGGGGNSGVSDPNGLPDRSGAQQLVSQQAGNGVLEESGARAASSVPPLQFHLKQSAATATCLAGASVAVVVSSLNSQVEQMHITGSHLPPNVDFDVFLIQVPKAPFGLAWYQGDFQTTASGTGSVDFLGRFSVETFIVAPGVAPNRVVFHGPFPDASQNPATNPIHTYHLGMWFNSPADATRLHCPGTVTPFNGPHNAGIQAFNTAAFPDTAGPLINFHP